MIEIVIEALIYILPAYISNSSAMIFGGGKPLDSGKEFRGNRLLGNGKTWRGLTSGLIFGSLTAVAIGILKENLFISLYGILIALGGLLGDIVASFFKRRIGIKRGEPAVILDQLDFVVGALALGSILFIPSTEHIVIILILTPVLHLLSNIIGYFLGFKTNPW